MKGTMAWSYTACVLPDSLSAEKYFGLYTATGSDSLGVVYQLIPITNFHVSVTHVRIMLLFFNLVLPNIRGFIEIFTTSFRKMK